MAEPFHEVAVKIHWDTGDTIERYFESVEAGLLWERQTITRAKRRRKPEHRQRCLCSYYAGVSPSLTRYSGKIRGSVQPIDLESYEVQQVRRAFAWMPRLG